MDVVPMSASGAEFVAAGFVGKEVVVYGSYSINVVEAHFDKKKGIVLVSENGKKYIHIPVVGVVERKIAEDRCRNCGEELRIGVQMFPCSNCLVNEVCHVCKAHCNFHKSRPMCDSCFSRIHGKCRNRVVSKKI